MQSEYFIFDGIKSADMGQYIVRLGNSESKSPFFGGQDIEEESLKDKITPYHFGTGKQPIEFMVEISPVDEDWTPKMKNELGRWLIHETYKSFQTADDLGKVYYVIVTEAPDFEMYGNKGFIPITFRANSAYAWSPIYISEFDISNNINTKIIEMDNLSNINRKYFPKIEIQLIGDTTGVEFRNLSNGGKMFKFTGLAKGEIVSIDCENEVIKSNILLTNPFSKFSGDYLELAYGVNQIEVTGKCIVRTKMQFPILQ